ncbi:hypothetical protein [Ligilactobacillus apodemi]|nr:hypothetical protein [Ligilactobacillus apodemi]MCR1901705.1 hypothetical protein [Ligilactobacillus apodemi]
MTISSKTSTEELIKTVMDERSCSYKEAIELLLNLTRSQGTINK